MKKLTAILMSLVLILGCFGAATAEGTGKVTLGSISINGAFTLQCGLPEGYRVQPLRMSQELYQAVILSEDPEKPVMQLSVAFDETYSDVDRMNDLDDEALGLLEKTFTDMDPTVEITYGETGLGTRLLIARQTEVNFNYIDFLSVYKGYFVEFVLVPSETATNRILTDDQLRMCIDFLTDLDFIPGAAIAVKPDIEGKTWIADLSDYDAEANTVKAVLRAYITIDGADALKIGDTLEIDGAEELIESLEKDEYGDIIINEEITLREEEGAFHAYLYEAPYLKNAGEMTLEIPESLRFMDGSDPAEDTTEGGAAEFIALLTGENPEDPGFAVDNTKVTFDDEGKLSVVERFYSPWQ